jgi:hypothetical protein
MKGKDELATTVPSPGATPVKCVALSLREFHGARRGRLRRTKIVIASRRKLKRNTDTIKERACCPSLYKRVA